MLSLIVKANAFLNLNEILSDLVKNLHVLSLHTLHKGCTSVNVDNSISNRISFKRQNCTVLTFKFGKKSSHVHIVLCSLFSTHKYVLNFLEFKIIQNLLTTPPFTLRTKVRYPTIFILAKPSNICFYQMKHEMIYFNQ